MTDTPTPQSDAPAAQAAAPQAVAFAGAPVFDRQPLTHEQLAILAAGLSPLVTWEFKPEDKAYQGRAPFGVFTLTRNAAGKLVADYKNAEGNFTSRLHLSDQDSVAKAKSVVALRILEAYNSSRRDDPLLNVTVPSEPDLI